MESFAEMTSKVTALVRATGIEDPGRMVVVLERNVPTRRCPSGPGGGRSPRSTSWRSWPPTTPPPRARRVRCCAGRACIPATSWRGAGPATPVRWLGWPFRADVGGATRKPSRSPALEAARNNSWSRSWPRPASWWMCRQNCTRSWRRSPRARTPSRGRRRDRPGDHRTGPAHRRAGRRAGRRRVAGRLLPPPPAQPGTAAAGAGPAPRPAPAAGAERGRASRRSSTCCTATGSSTCAPAEVWATLLDEGVYLGSESTMYRLLRQARRDPRAAPPGHPPGHA